MHSRIREILRKRLLSAVGIADNHALTYAQCREIASRIDCDTNSIARLLGLNNFKQTQKLTPDLESKISTFLQYKDFASLEYSFMLEMMVEDLKEFQAHKEKELKRK